MSNKMPDFGWVARLPGRPDWLGGHIGQIGWVGQVGWEGQIDQIGWVGQVGWIGQIGWLAKLAGRSDWPD